MNEQIIAACGNRCIACPRYNAHPYAYKVIRDLNEELRSKGFQTVSGRINRIFGLKCTTGIFVTIVQHVMCVLFITKENRAVIC